jgi:serralysin
MTLQTSFRELSLGIEDDLSGALSSSLDDYFFAKSLLFHEKDGHSAPGGGTQAAPDLVPGDTSTTFTVDVGGFVEGAIDAAGDRDWYRVNLVAGQSYTFSTLFSLDIFDTVLRLRDPSGTLLFENDDANSSNGYLLSEIRYTATSSGTFLVDVGGFSSSDTGGFFLSVSRPVADNIAASTVTTASLTIGNSINGNTNDTGDHDWYAVQLVAGQTYLFTTEATGGNTDTDSALYLRDASGNLLAFNDDSNGTYSRIRYTATATGTFYVDVGGWAEFESGAYRLTSALAQPLELYTYDQIAFEITNTYWGGTVQRFNVQAGGALTVNVTQLTADGQFLAREALKLWSDATGIAFNEVGSGGQIVFDDAASGAFSTSTLVGGFIFESEVNISTQWLVTSGTGLRSYSFQTYLHEIGHALGLGHAGPYNNNANFTQDAAYLNDSWATTVMSYFDQQENPYFNGLNFTNAFVLSPMIADLVAVASLYGQANGLRTGDSIYGFNNNTGRAIYDAAVGQTAAAITVVDHGGVDTLDFSGYSSAQRLDLNQEAFSNIGGSVGNLAIARGTVIENAKGGNGNDVLIGNSSNNRLDGGAGTDQLYGGAGNDTFVTNLQADIVFEDLNGGTDTVESASNFYLYANIENLTLTGSANNFGVGNDLANTMLGNSGENLLIGWGGIDTIFGGASRDAIFGVEGDDILNGEAGIDYIVAGNGNDTLNGGADADEMYGEAGNDTLNGGSSFDTDIMVGGADDDALFGNSGLGDFDFMYGNQGDDIFYVDTPADLVFEQSGEGHDTVYANIAGAGFYLYDHIEDLILEGNTPFGVGNGLANNLIGNDIGNFLLGGGGNDFLNGGAGNDVLFGEAGNDIFYFASGTGGDVIGDFVRGQDKIDLTSFGAMTFAQLQATFVQDGNVGAFTVGGGDLIVLHNITMSQLTASDFNLASLAEPPPKAGAGVGGLSQTDFSLATESLFGDDGMIRWQADYHNGSVIP